MAQNRNEIFTSAPIPKAVATLAIPTVLSMLVTVIYNMADAFFVGRTGDEFQVAAISLSTPVFLLCMAVGNMFGIGGSAFISRSLGAGKRDRVKNISSLCFYGGAVMGVLLIIMFLAGMPLILRFIGTSEFTVGYARDYLSWIAYGAPFVIVSTALTNIVRGEGAAKVAMLGMMLGTVLNIILDPIFIITLDMGVTGAAIATVIGNFASTVFFVVYLLRGKTILSIKPSDFKISANLLGGVFGVGLPASINNVLMSASNIIMNNFLSDYGDTPVAAMGVAMKANMLVVLLQIGVGIGVQPLVGFNYGAKNYTRMKAVMKFAMLCNVILGSVITLIFFLNTRAIIPIFLKDAQPAVVDNGVTMLRALMLSGPLLGVLFVFTFTFQAMGKALSSLILSISRQGLLFLPTLIIADRLFGLDGLIYAQPLADYVAVVLSLCMFIFIYRRLKRDDKKPTVIHE